MTGNNMVKVKIDDGFYDWVEKIVLYAPEFDTFCFQNIIDKIVADQNYKTRLATDEEVSADISAGYTSTDVFFALFPGCIDSLDGQLSDNVECGYYQLTDKGRQFKKIGNWFEWHKREINKTN